MSENILAAMERSFSIAYALAHLDDLPWDVDTIRNWGRELDSLLRETDAGERLSLANPEPVEAGGFIGESYAACMILAARLFDPAGGPVASDMDAMRCVKEAERAIGKDVGNLSPIRRAVVDAIRELWQAGVQWPGLKQIAPKSGYCESTVRHELPGLVDSGVLTKGTNGRGYKVRT